MLCDLSNIMEINERVLKNLKDAVACLDKRPEETCFIKLRDREERYIDWMVTRGAAGTWYYGDGRWIYWDGTSYGFTFDPKTFREPETPEAA